MSKNNNSPQEWDRLLSNELYLGDSGKITNVRVLNAKVWWKGQQNILNIGSGQGFLEEVFRDEIINKKVNWTAMDISSSGLKRIKKLYKHSYCVLGDIRKLPFENNSYDLIYCMEVLEHLKKTDLKVAIKEMQRVAKKNANFVISVPVYEPCALKNHPVGHNRKYTPKIIMEELKENGFKIIDKKNLYAFNNLYEIKAKICEWTDLRRPSVVMHLCQKS